MALQLDPTNLEDLRKRPDSSTGEVMAAQFGLALMNSETLTLGRFVTQKFAANTDDIISPEQANEEFDFDVPVTEPTSRAELELMHSNTVAQRKLRDIISRGDDSISNNFFGFVAGIAGAGVDPIGILSGKAFGAYKVGKSVVSRAMGKAFLQGTKRRKILEASVEGAFGNLVTEAAIIQQQKRELQDTDAVTQLMFAATAGAAFPAAIGTLGAGFDKVMTRFDGLKEDQMERIFDYTTAKLMAGKNPTLTDAELNLAKGKRGVELRKEYEDLVAQRQEVGPSAELDQEIAAKADEIDEMARHDENNVAMREEVNSERHDIYNNPRAKERLTDLDTKDQTPAEILEQKMAELDDTELELVNKELEALSNSEALIDDLAKVADHCIKQG